MATTKPPPTPSTTARAKAKRVAGSPRTKKPLDAGQLLAMDQKQLDALFRASPAGPTPEGVAEGTVIAGAGTPAARALAPLLGLAWRGKVFYEPEHDLLNRILPIGLRAVRASVYRDKSWFDGKQTIVLDYSQSLLPARSIRDEIREVAPGLYLGIVYVRRMKTINFALRFST